MYVCMYVSNTEMKYHRMRTFGEYLRVKFTEEALEGKFIKTVKKYTEL